jgi:RNA polymerase nonessential primary-like sigma factor
VQEHEVLDHIDEWLGFLADKPREIIERRFGLSCYGLERGEPQTLEQVAREVGVTRERVRQIQIQALSKLKEKRLHMGRCLEVREPLIEHALSWYQSNFIASE